MNPIINVLVVVLGMAAYTIKYREALAAVNDEFAYSNSPQVLQATDFLRLHEFGEPETAEETDRWDELLAGELNFQVVSSQQREPVRCIVYNRDRVMDDGFRPFTVDWGRYDGQSAPYMHDWKSHRLYQSHQVRRPIRERMDLA